MISASWRTSRYCTFASRETMALAATSRSDCSMTSRSTLAFLRQRRRAPVFAMVSGQGRTCTRSWPFGSIQNVLCLAAGETKPLPSVLHDAKPRRARVRTSSLPQALSFFSFLTFMYISEMGNILLQFSKAFIMHLKIIYGVQKKIVHTLFKKCTYHSK